MPAIVSAIVCAPLRIGPSCRGAPDRRTPRAGFTVAATPRMASPRADGCRHYPPARYICYAFSPMGGSRREGGFRPARAHKRQLGIHREKAHRPAIAADDYKYDGNYILEKTECPV